MQYTYRYRQGECERICMLLSHELMFNIYIYVSPKMPIHYLYILLRIIQILAYTLISDNQINSVQALTRLHF